MMVYAFNPSTWELGQEKWKIQVSQDCYVAGFLWATNQIPN